MALRTPLNSDKNEDEPVEEKEEKEEEDALHMHTTTTNYPKLIRAPVCCLHRPMHANVHTDEEMSDRRESDVTPRINQEKKIGHSDERQI